MKKLIIGLLLLVGFNGWGQKDTLEYTTPREVADTLFGLFDERLYGDALFDRSLTEDPLLIQQFRKDYSGIPNAWSWLQAYSDIAVSYTDPNFMLPDSMLIDKITNSYVQYERESEEEKVIQPFGLLLHEMSKIDSNLYQKKDAFTNQRSQLKLNSSIDEKQIYSKVMLKEAALLELHGKHGYEEGVIKYNRDFISTGPNIKLHSIQLDVGNGFQKFSEKNNEINYRIEKDRQVGKVVVNYSLNGRNKNDTLSFYLTTEIYKFENQDDHQEKGKYRWDGPPTTIAFGDEKSYLKYSVRYGCGNGNTIRRPIIIAPPYRPKSQFWTTMNGYYDQFNFKSLISSLSDMGYDVIFLKQTPGNRSIVDAGNTLVKFLKHINDEKKLNYPNEDWENVVIGFSAGGQHWRWTLKKMEKEHMDWGTPHHHTRLYIPFDSPHWGANVPIYAQAVYYDFNATFDPQAATVYGSLKDDASRSMLMNHIAGSYIQESGTDRIIYPTPDLIRQNLVNDLENSFNHQFTPINDLRRSFPTFTRNVAISVGHNSKDYSHNDEFKLHPGKKLFSQKYVYPGFFGLDKIERRIYASEYGPSSTVFIRKDVKTIGIIPLWRNRNYKTNWAYEWDMAQGGYKDEFYDGFITGPVSILRASGLFGFSFGKKHYDEHMGFMPMVSALGINPEIWKNNNLYYNLKDKELMYKTSLDQQQDNRSNTYGYPNLGHPNTHFNITPFEAIYCDIFTSEHIKMQKSAGNNVDKNNHLVYTRNFILDEVEADIVYLQNKTIGKNHIQWDPNYRYKAWYKATDQIVFSKDQSPKTDPGPFIIEKTGEVTAYACNSITMYPGFHAQQGGKYHTYVHCDGCSRPREQGKSRTNDGENQVNEDDIEERSFLQSLKENERHIESEKLKVFPNPSTKGFTIEFPEDEGEYIISNTNGKLFQQKEVKSKSIFIELPKGIYFVKWINKNGIQTQKMIAL